MTWGFSPRPSAAGVETQYASSDIGKSTGPRSSTGENGGGLMKTVTVPVLLSGKKFPLGSPSNGNSNVEKKIGPVKVLEDQ